VTQDSPKTFAYADPPYIGQAKKAYGGTWKARPGQDIAEVKEVDHEELIRSLLDTYPDGWALSLSSPSLRVILPLCPPEIRVMAWVKPFASFKPNVNPAYAWEPVLVFGGRKLGREVVTQRDWCSVPITLKKGLVGAKPGPFCYWLFSVLGMQKGDTLIDVFPGSGAVSRAWKRYQTSGQIELFGKR
jgi:hypothetical protein